MTNMGIGLLVVFLLGAGPAAWAGWMIAKQDDSKGEPPTWDKLLCSVGFVVFWGIVILVISCWLVPQAVS